MKVDAAGNIWACAQGGVVILSPEGKQLGALVIMWILLGGVGKRHAATDTRTKNSQPFKNT